MLIHRTELDEIEAMLAAIGAPQTHRHKATVAAFQAAPTTPSNVGDRRPVATAALKTVCARSSSARWAERARQPDALLHGIDGQRCCDLGVFEVPADLDGGAVFSGLEYGLVAVF